MRSTCRFVFAIALLAAVVPATHGQTRPDYQYVVKFVCGKAPEASRLLAPGEYFTAINVHNPNERGFAFRKKFAIALPGEKPGRVSKFFDTKLGPDEAFEIDCPDILSHLDASRFAKGFAVIESDHELDVVAVYTASGRSGTVETMDVEEVRARRRDGGGTDGKPDLLPVPDPQTQSFCRRKDMKLIVTIRNQGTAPSGPSTTRVDFPSGPQTQPTPPIPAGGSVDLIFDIPPGCFSPDCSFRITADWGNVVSESNEVNNTASGTCLG